MGVEKNRQEALRLYRLAAAQGHADAQKALDLCTPLREKARFFPQPAATSVADSNKPSSLPPFSEEKKRGQVFK